ncbi:unnamed protein product [marine sediment metagenome]|uniref:Uncharacterized protein n=1 Tax=marine sediment metagenome TaxID=412755 RepID=X0SJD7_9ZZZZ
MARKKKEVVKKVEAEVPMVVGMDFEADSGAGFEGADSQSFAIPYLVVLQKNSPQVDEDDGKYMKDAKAGMFFNTVTQELYSTVRLCPAYYQRMLVEWVPRDAGGGFRGAHHPSTIDMNKLARDDSGRFRMENGNFLADTRYHFVLIVADDGSSSPAVISLTSTQIKKSKQWMSQMNSLKIPGKAGPYTPPMSSHLYNATTVKEENDKGSWKGWKIEMDGMLSAEQAGIYVNAADFRKMVQEGDAVVTAPPETGGSTSEEKEEAPF